MLDFILAKLCLGKVFILQERGSRENSGNLLLQPLSVPTTQSSLSPAGTRPPGGYEPVPAPPWCGAQDTDTMQGKRFLLLFPPRQ